MKTSGSCPKCQGTDIIRVPTGGGLYGNTIPQGLRFMPVTRYVCYSCGFSEEWVESRGDLERLREKFGWARDHPAPAPPNESIESQLGLS